MITQELPRFVRDLLASPPPRGGGLNRWLFHVARVMHPHRNRAEIIEALRAATAGESVKPGEIERAVERSQAHAWQPGAPLPRIRTEAWPKVNMEQREAVTKLGGGLVDLWEASPIRFENAESNTEQIVDALLPGDPLLCTGKSAYTFATRRREAWRGCLASLQFIVPSPMSAQSGLTQDGKPSEHTLTNTGARRFLVIEQDLGTSDEQAAILLHLAERAPLALAVHSGSRSIHGWFFCDGKTEPRLEAFMRRAVALGADRATWTRSQFVRMPDGTRDNGNRQTVYFFNPEVIR